MSKWADFVITKVKYDKNHNYIEDVERLRDNGTSNLSDKKVKSRSVIINAIKDGFTYVTAFKTSEGNLKKGSIVKIIKINGIEYIKTEENNIERDNLENLPEF